MNIAHYEIVEQLGAGGMGEVYRARDPKLGRDVAIKVLPGVFLENPERRARFEREARVLASINHPHIGAIYGVEDADGYRALVLELIEGETLAGRITAAGRLPVDEALGIAGQIAEALEAAHEKGIVHRDLKPANIMLNAAGSVKVLDFGLARFDGGDASGSAIANSPTLTYGGTAEGVILGTAVYLSPEQARGRAVDKRSDIWAFGCVLFEMLTGRRVFGRETVSDSIAAILGQEPDWKALPADLPDRIEHLLRRCLTKDPRRRLHDIADARIEIEDTVSGSGSVVSAQPTTTARSGRLLGTRLPWLIASAATIGLLAVAIYPLRRSGAPSSGSATPVKFTLPPPGVVTFTPAGNFVAYSPDGKYLAFVAASNSGLPTVWLRPIDALEAREFPGTEGARAPFWSPDSRYIGFFVPGGSIRRVPVGGGPPQTLSAAALATPTGATWNRDGVILFSTLAGPIQRISDAGGTPASPVTKRDDAKQQLAHSFPCFLPDGKRFLYYMRSANPEFDGIYVRELGGDGERLLLHASSNVAYVPSGHLLYVREGVLLAHPFDAERAAFTGDPTPVAEGVDSFAESGIAAFSVSDTGALVYRTTDTAPVSRLIWFDRAGKRLSEVGEPAAYRNPRLSPDRRKLAVEMVDVTGNRDIWIFDLARGVRTKFTFGPGRDAAAVWSHDGQKIVWQGPNETLIKSSDGKEREQVLFNEPWIPDDWLPDGSGFLLHPGAPRQVLLMDPLTKSRTKVLEGRGITTHARLSPDGKWVAFANADSGRFEVIVQDFPNSSGRWQVSTSGGLQPKWRADGKELYYISTDGRLMAVPVKSGTFIEFGKPQSLFQTQTETITGFTWHQYDVSEDGQRFLVNTMEAVLSPVTVVYDWPALVRNRR